MILCFIFSISSAYAITQEEYEIVVQQRDALYAQLITAGIEPCISILSEKSAVSVPTEQNETSANEFLYASNGTEIQINAFIGDSTDVIIPQTIDGLPVTRIRKKAFEETNITSVYIPEGVEQIESEAFRHCYSLHTISLPSIVSLLPYYCFCECKKLTTVNGLYNIHTFGEWCFLSCKSFTDDLIFNQDTIIAQGAFYDTGITKASFLSGKCGAGSSAFRKSKIQVFYIDQKCEFEFIAETYESQFGPFYDCKNFTTLIIPETVTWFPDNLLNNCKLVTVYMPAGSPAEKVMKERFVTVNTADYDRMVQKYSNESESVYQ